MSRVFLMKWYHFSVEYFEDLRNVNHCEFLIMRKQESGKYLLESKLRTWSELRRERAEKEDEEDNEDSGESTKEKGNGTSKDSSKLDKANLSSSAASSPVETRRRWGGCPNGCNHDKSFKIRQNLADLVQSDSTISSHALNGIRLATQQQCGVTNGRHSPATASADPSFNGNGVATHTTAASPSIASRRSAGKRFHSHTAKSSIDTDAEADGDTPPAEDDSESQSSPRIDVTRARDAVVSSPDGTPSYISVEDRLRSQIKSPSLPPHPYPANMLLHLGRDGGGTYSGHNSVAASDIDSSEDEFSRRRRAAAEGGRLKVATGSFTDHPHVRQQSRMGRGTKANRLGDAPHSSDGEHEADVEPENDDSITSGGEPDDDLARMEQEDKSLVGSVY
jgi:hypothetical protein